MIKIPTLYKKDPTNLALVINEINPCCEWVFTPDAIATRKFDGTAAAIINGELYKRYDVKKGRKVPDGAMPCQEPDAITGHWPHWVKCDPANKEDKYFWEGFKNLLSSMTVYGTGAEVDKVFDGTYELCGPKVQGNPERFENHVLVKHGSVLVELGLWAIEDLLYNFKNFKHVLSEMDIEGIVFYHRTDSRMCKIRKSDFGIKRVSTGH